MVFVIQNSANRSVKATQLKRDEIIRAGAGARNDFVTLDKASEEVLEEREQEFDHLAAEQPAMPARQSPRSSDQRRDSAY